MIDPTLHAQLVHAAMLIAEALVAAAALTFLWLVLPHVRGPR